MKELTNFLDSYLKMGVPGYDCIVCKDGQCIYRKFDGYSDIEEKTPMTGEELYYLYSCSKPITCTAALQLFERGLFRLEDPLCEYIPEFENMRIKTCDGVAYAKNPIRILDLFTMTAGFRYEQSEWTQEVRKAPEKYTTLEAIKLLYFEPGTAYCYSFCHDVLPALIEVITGKKFSVYVEENIFEPLGMKETTFAHKLVSKANIASLHRYEGAKAHTVDKENTMKSFLLGDDYESGGAGCISTVQEYILFLEALRKGDVILSKQTIDRMVTNCITKEQLDSCPTVLPKALRQGYGYGLGVRCPIDGMPYTDFGWDGAAGSHGAIDRENGISIFVAEHVLGSPSDAVRLDTINFIRKDLQ